MTLIGRARARGVETLTLDSPHNRNALSAALVGELVSSLAETEKDGDVRAIVLTHTGNTFSAGADLKDPADSDGLVGLLRQIVELRKPVVARVTGPVRAGGLGLLAARRRTFSQALAETARVLKASLTGSGGLGIAQDVSQSPSCPGAERRKPSARVARPSGRWSVGSHDPTEEGARRRLGAGRAGDTLPYDRYVLLIRLIGLRRDAADLAALSARLFASAQAREGMTAFLERRDPAWAL